MSVLVEVEQLSKHFGGVRALDEVSFSVESGEWIAIMGPSGSGKTTLINILGGLDSPSSGRALVDGLDLGPLSEKDLTRYRADKVGFIFQQFHLVPYLTALENVMLPLELRGEADAKERATAMLGRVGLSSRLKHYPKYMSGGEQQRVALARAFVTEPPLLFADEPTGSLDAATGEAVIQLMFELNRERGSTLVLVTHDPSIAARCGRTITIAAGRLV